MRTRLIEFSGLLVTVGLAGLTGCSANPVGSSSASLSEEGVTQSVSGARLYMTHYAEFEEPDTSIPQALYIDAATGQPTNELFLTTPFNTRDFQPQGQNPTVLTAPATDTSKPLPYMVTPPGFRPLPPPPQVVGTISAVTGLPASVVQANTHVLLVAIGQFLADGTSTAIVHGHDFEVDKTMHFQVRIRIGFLFQPPAGTPATPVGILVSYLDMGTLMQLTGLPPPPNPSEIVVYSWRVPMKLSTKKSYVRNIATEPPPVADPFPTGDTQINFQGVPVDRLGHYTIVGFGGPANLEFQAPPALVQFLFHVPQLTDVEFAVEESGTLTSHDD